MINLKKLKKLLSFLPEEWQEEALKIAENSDNEELNSMTILDLKALAISAAIIFGMGSDEMMKRNNVIAYARLSAVIRDCMDLPEA